MQTYVHRRYRQLLRFVAHVLCECSYTAHRYADRRRKKGTLYALRWLYQDRCCRGCKDVTKYFGTDIFPAVQRAPLVDSLHATQVR